MRTTLAVRPSCAGEARRIVRAYLDAWELTEAAGTVSLLVTELLGRAMREAEPGMGSEADLSIRLVGSTVYVEVAGRRGRLAPPAEATSVKAPLPGEAFGSGVLLQTLADQWGSDAGPSGSYAWFSVDVDRLTERSGFSR